MMRNVQNNFIKTDVMLLNVLSNQQPQTLTFSGDHYMRQETRLLFVSETFQLSVKTFISRRPVK